MTAERIPDTEWPAVISQGPGYYGLRLPQEYGTIVEYVHPRAMCVAVRREEACSVCGMRKSESTGGRCGECLFATVTIHAGPALGAER
jgi:hypothetical protein